jgi:hypothetical protein
VSDDICLIDPRSDPREPLPVIPVAAWLKLWRQSIEQIGEVALESNRIFSKDDKFRIFLDESRTADDSANLRPRLKNLVFLDRPEADDDSTSLDPMSGVFALSRLIGTIYLGYLLEATGQLPRAFQTCSRILNRTEAFRLVAPRGWDRIDEGLDLVERTLLD